MMQQRGEHIVNIFWNDVVQTQPTLDPVLHRAEQKKEQQRQHAEAMQPGVQHIDTDRITIGPAFGGITCLQRPQDYIQQRNLQHTEQQGLDGVIADLGVVGES